MKILQNTGLPERFYLVIHEDDNFYHVICKTNNGIYPNVDILNKRFKFYQEVDGENWFSIAVDFQDALINFEEECILKAQMYQRYKNQLGFEIDSQE